MKKRNFAFAIISSSLATLSTPAIAWECVAASPSAWGVGISPYRSSAVNIALNECSTRTPWGQACYIQRCVNSRSTEADVLKGEGGSGKPLYMRPEDTLDFRSADPSETQGGMKKVEQ